MELWIPVVATLVGVVIGAGLTFLREFLTTKAKRKKDAAYLTAVVSGALDRFVAGCELVVNDDGLSQGQYDEDGTRSAQSSLPEFRPEELKVEWPSIPAELIYRVLDLPYKREAANSYITEAGEHADPPDYENYFDQRQYQYAKLGLEAVNLSRDLRKHSSFPDRDRGAWDPAWYFQEVIDRIDRQWKERDERHAANPGLPGLPAAVAPDPTQ